MLEPRLSFETLVIGGWNELAAGAARAAAEAPGVVYNPLVICGGPGLGKTHILHAIGLHARRLDPELAMHLETAQSLGDHVTEGISHGQLSRLHEVLARLDLLLIDDLDRFAGLERTQHELARAASGRIANRRQLVVASRRPPSEVPGLIPELADVLSDGVVVDIGALDDAGRCAILFRLAADRGIILDRATVSAVAARPLDDVRELERIVDRMVALARQLGHSPRPQDLAHVLGGVESGSTDGEEFDSFLSDVSRALAVVVEEAPWRRTIAEAILEWEGKGIRTTRLDEALQADTPPDVDALLDRFARDAGRLLQIRANLSDELRALAPDDPDALDRAEALVPRERKGRRPVVEVPPEEEAIDAWFDDPARVVFDWVEVESRLVEVSR